MESYPGELLVGVFPLVFCVDATLQNKLLHTHNHNTNEKSGEETTGTGTTRINKQQRSQFDKFLDAIAASSSTSTDQDQHHSNYGDGDGGADDDDNADSPLLRKVAEEQSDNEDEILLYHSGGSGAAGTGTGGSNTTTTANTTDSASSDIPTRHNRGSGRLSPFSLKRDGPHTHRRNSSSRKNKNKNSVDDNNNNRIPHNNHNNSDSTSGLGLEISSALATALQQGQSFFQRARIIAISTRHGFPPSKDPTAIRNRVLALTGQPSGPTTTALMQLQQQQQQHQNQSRNSILAIPTNARLLSALRQRPLEGILPRGWLEKHAAALPSVIVVVTQLHQHQHNTRQEQDALLLAALENLQYSLAPKRKVEVKVVALVQEGVSPIMAEQWSQGILTQLPAFVTHHKEDVVTLIRARELQAVDHNDPSSTTTAPATTTTSSSSLPRLHHRIRQCSRQYYQQRVHDIKHKLLRLGPHGRHGHDAPLLFPLLVRYYFKAAMFYEFQWQQTKSLQYMVEAYRFVELYYRYLLQQREDVALDDDDDNDNDDDNNNDNGYRNNNNNNNNNNEEDVVQHHYNKRDSISGGGEEGVELSLTTTTATTTASSSLPPLPPATVAEDMIYQCRAVADWLNFKILQSGLVSNTPGGLLVASQQMQRHAQAFCSPSRSFLRVKEAPAWWDWSYVAQQRMVVSQLLERYPARAVGELGRSSTSSGGGGEEGEFDEVLLRCCPWRTYEAATEALLQVGHHIKQFQKEEVEEERLISETTKRRKIRYVGDIDHEGFRSLFQEEAKKNHPARALQCAVRGIALYEKDRECLQKTQTLRPWSRSGGRLYYLAGGILVGLQRYDEAIPYLEQALVGLLGRSSSSSWASLAALSQRLLLHCYEKQPPLLYGSSSAASLDDHNSSRRKARTSLLLNSYFHAHLGDQELIDALENLATVNGVSSNGGAILRWSQQCRDDNDNEDDSSTTTTTTVPSFSLVVTFPMNTHATAGTKIKANIWLKSNIDYTVQVQQLSILSNCLGPLPVPITVNHDSNGGSGLLLKAHDTMEFRTELTLPMIDVVNQTNAVVKTARPRTGGITAGAGARFVPEHDDYVSQSGVRSWSLRCLGGKPFRCEGMVMVFHPVVPSSSTATTTINSTREGRSNIELTIQWQERTKQPNTKRTTFEEHNYLSSAWQRPYRSVPMKRGPRCLRLLPPTATMRVTNLTQEVTKGTVLEGTINRIVLQLQAGAEKETCANILIRATCTSSLLPRMDGGKENENIKEDQTNNPRVRTPVLVKQDASSKACATAFGYTLPDGWTLVGDGDGDGDVQMEGYKRVVPMLTTNGAAATTYAYFDLYRPTSEPIGIEGREEDMTREMIDETDNNYYNNCQTKLTLSIRYQPQKIGDADTDTEIIDIDEYVSLDHCVTVRWSSPLSVIFSSTARGAYPSGNRHPSNNVAMTAPYSGLLEKELIFIDQEQMLTTGSIEAAASADGLNVEIRQVQFTDHEKSENPCCRFKLVSGHGGDNDEDGTLYQGETNHPCRTLSVGSKLSFAWMTEVCMDDAYRKERLAASLGTISIQWQPSSIELPEDVVKMVMRDDDDSWGKNHGPLQFHSRPSTCCFRGPLCYIESAPFEAKAERLPDSVSIATPLEVTYRIRNKTPLDQEVEMMLLTDAVVSSSSPSNNNHASKESNESSFLISGHVHKRTSLGPYESHSFSYTAVPMKVGAVDLPAISISSKRYETWVVHEQAMERRSIYVCP